MPKRENRREKGGTVTNKQGKQATDSERGGGTIHVLWKGEREEVSVGASGRYRKKGYLVAGKKKEESKRRFWRKKSAKGRTLMKNGRRDQIVEAKEREERKIEKGSEKHWRTEGKNSRVQKWVYRG